MAGLFSPTPLATRRGGLDIPMLHRMECNACPLNSIKANLHPHMEPTGEPRPLIYILGEGPGKQEDINDEQFVGESGQLLRARIPRKYKGLLRFNNVVRTRPLGNATPGRVEIECCRPSVVADIERSKPKVIFGFGNVPLEWVSGFNGITLWRGRRMPVRVGNHACWYYPMLHPAFLLRQRRNDYGGARDIGSEEERMFDFDLRRAFAEIDDLPPPIVHTAEDAAANIECITEFGPKGLKRIAEALKWAAAQKAIGIDFETIGLRPYADKATILTAAVATAYEGVAFPFDHPEAEWTDDEYEQLVHLWINFLRTARGSKVSHNLAFEMEWTGYFFGKSLLRAGRWDDTATQACILDERKGKTKPGCFSLEFLVQQHFGFNLKNLTSLNKSNLANEPLDNVLLYNGMDAKYHCALFEKQDERIREEGLEDAYELGLRRVPTVILAQLKGVPVDQAEVERLDTKYSTRIAQLETDISVDLTVVKYQRTTSKAFNPQSNPDVIYVFHKMLKCDECEVVDKYTGKKKFSGDETVLSAIAKRTELTLPSAIINLRKAYKQKSTYIDPLIAGGENTVIHPDGMLHAQFNTIFAETGRLSCEGPNLQNFPKRDGEAIEVRKPIVAKRNCVILAVDYGQIEARCIAMFTKDKAFCQALWEDYDVHMEWAERLAHAYPARIGGKAMLKDKKAMKNFRTDIKNQWTFPLFFGARLESAAGYLDIPEDIIRPHYNAFWKQFSGVKEWQEDQLKFYHEMGYTECLTGRRRRGPMSLNQVMNSPVQGTAAEIVMTAMCRLSELNDPELQPEINIHDDLTFLRVPVNKVDDVAERVIDIMLDVPYEWAKIVPITVEISVGTNWMELKDAGTFSSATWGK